MVASKEEQLKCKRRASKREGERSGKRLMYEEGQGNAIRDEDDNVSSAGEETETDDAELETGYNGGLFNEEDIKLF